MRTHLLSEMSHVFLRMREIEPSSNEYETLIKRLLNLCAIFDLPAMSSEIAEKEPEKTKTEESAQVSTPVAVEEPVKAEEPTPTKTEEPAPSKAEEPEEHLTLADIRKACKLAREKGVNLYDVYAKFGGATNLTEVKPEHYSALKKHLTELCNAS